MTDQRSLSNEDKEPWELTHDPSGPEKNKRWDHPQMRSVPLAITLLIAAIILTFFPFLFANQLIRGDIELPVPTPEPSSSPQGSGNIISYQVQTDGAGQGQFTVTVENTSSQDEAFQVVVLDRARPLDGEVVELAPNERTQVTLNTELAEEMTEATLMLNSNSGGYAVDTHTLLLQEPELPPGSY